jgi:tRNA pseudouridine55 synthase
MNAVHGVLVVDKPLGLTSHDVVSRIRKVLKTRKVGHAGTLDPEASGVLILGVNRGTRLMQYLVGDHKRYQARIRLGVATVSDDAAGEVISVTENNLTHSQIAEKLADFVGKIMQRPSSVSAIKVNGMRAHALVRAGTNVELAPRPIEIFELTLNEVIKSEYQSVAITEIELDVFCSSGTYIRALARDVGTALGVGGSVLSLRRTQSGPFTELEAIALDKVTSYSDLIALGVVIERIMAAQVVSSGEALDLAHGRSIKIVNDDCAPMAVLNEEKQLIAIGDLKQHVFQPNNVFIDAAELSND